MRCDWLPERSRWSDLARSGLPVASKLSIESLIHKKCNTSFHFLVVLGERSLKCSQHLPKEKEMNIKSSWGRVNFVLALMTVTLNARKLNLHKICFFRGFDHVLRRLDNERINLFPRVLRLFVLRLVYRRDSDVLGFYYRRISAIKKWKSLRS